MLIGDRSNTTWLGQLTADLTDSFNSGQLFAVVLARGLFCFAAVIDDSGGSGWGCVVFLFLFWSIVEFEQ